MLSLNFVCPVFQSYSRETRQSSSISSSSELQLSRWNFVPRVCTCVCVRVCVCVCVCLCIFSVPGLSPEQLTAPAGHNASVDLGPELVTCSVYFYWDEVKDGQQKILCGINKHNGSANTPGRKRRRKEHFI